MDIDSLSKTVKIPVRIVNGKVNYYYGGELPSIKSGAIGDLVIKEYDVEDNNFLLVSQYEERIEILKQNTILMFAVNINSIPEKLWSHVNQLETRDHKNYLFVKAKLLTPLELLIRGSKKFNLLEADCYITCLEKEASSLNNALTIISQEFEPERKSHTGNVFEKCYYQDGQLWHPLEDLRLREESNFEERLFLDNKLFHLAKDVRISIECDRFNRDIFGENELIVINHIFEKEYIDGSVIKEKLKDTKKDYINIINDLLDKSIIYEFRKNMDNT